MELTSNDLKRTTFNIHSMYWIIIRVSSYFEYLIELFMANHALTV